MPVHESTLAADVNDELRLEPALDADRISVYASDGSVTLTGTVDTYFQKALAEAVAMRVAGVRSVANDITVDPPIVERRTDAEIAQAAAHNLNWSVAVPKNVQAVVKDGWLTLHGAVTWRYERDAAERAVRELLGVRGVTNLITVERQPVGADIKTGIERRVARSAALDAGGLAVEVDGSRVVLHGAVRSWMERDEAKRLAWTVPGVLEVENRTTIRHT